VFSCCKNTHTNDGLNKYIFHESAVVNKSELTLGYASNLDHNYVIRTKNMQYV